MVTSVRTDGTYVSSSTYGYTGFVSTGGSTWNFTGAYQGGAVTHIVTTTTKNGVAQPTTDTANVYLWRDGALQQTTYFTPDTAHPTVFNDTDFSYDAVSHLLQAQVNDGNPRTINFITDSNGQVMKRDQTSSAYSVNPHEIHYYFNGVQIGDVSNNGTSDTDYAASIAAHIAVPGSGGMRDQPARAPGSAMQAGHAST